MHTLKARVENGRIKLDEPTEIANGEIVDLVPLDEVLAQGGDCLTDEDRAALHQSLEKGEADIAAGRTASAQQVLAQLRSRS